MIRFSVLLISLIWVNALLGQQLNLVQYSINDGLAQEFVYDIVQDSSGYLWIATGDGLSRFNGTEIKSFKKEDGLNENFVTRLFPDKSGKLWIGHYGGGVSIYENGSVQETIQLSEQKISAIFQVDEQIVVIPQLGDLFIYEAGSWDTVSTLSLQSRVVQSVLHLGGGKMFLATNVGGFFAEVNADSLAISSELETLRYANVSKAFKLQDRILCQTQDNGIFSIEYNIENLGDARCREADQLLDAKLVGIDAEKNGWYSTDSSLTNLKFADNVAIPIWDITESSGLMTSNVVCVYEDKSGNVWLGTYGEGLVKVPRNASSCYNLEASIGRPEDMLVIKDKAIYISSQQGLFQLKPTSSQRQLHQFDLETLIDQPTERIAVVGQEVWAIINSKELQAYNSETGVFREIKLSTPDAVLELSTISVKTANEIYVSTKSDGVFVIDANGQILDRFTTANGLLHNTIDGVYVDKQGAVWMYSFGTGLSKLQDDEFFYYSLADGLSNLNITAISEVSEQRMVVSTTGGGLFLIGDTIQKVNTSDGLYSNYFYDVFHNEKSDNTWAIGRDGLSVLSESGEVLTSNALLFDYFETSFAGKSGQMAENQLILLTNNGIIISQIAELEAPQETETALTSVTVSGQEKSTNEKLILPYDNYRIRFEFEAISMGPISDLLYAYRIPELDSGWTYTQDNAVYFSALPDGNYTFEVAAVNFSSSPKSSPALFKFKIKTPLYRSVWFVILCMLLLSVAVFAIVMYREYTLRQANRRLENMVKFRTRNLQRQQEELETFTYAVSHDLKNPVLNISELLKVLDEIEPSKDDEAQQIREMLTETSLRLSTNLQKLMEVMRSRKETGEEEVEVSLAETISEVRSTIYTMFTQTNTELVTDLSIDSIVFNKDNLHSILYNLITNGIKYRRSDVDPKIVIESRDAGGKMVEIIVADNGLGLNLKKDYDKLFGMFKRVHQQGEGSGVGLYLIKTIIERSGGRITVESEIGKGTTFHVFLPRNGSQLLDGELAEHQGKSNTGVNP